MCSVTVMCATLLVLGVGSVAGSPLQSCTHQCTSHCEALLSQRLENSLPICCNCTRFCATSCKLHKQSKSFTIDQLESRKTAGPDNCTGGNCEFFDFIWKQMAASCGSCRTRRTSSQELREVTLIARSVGIELGDIQDGGSSVDDDTQSSGPSRVWGLRLKSMTTGCQTVSATVAWTSTLRRGACFLVTWQTTDGVIRGNLLTNTTSASLTLLPDNVYHIQVTSVVSGDSSESLPVDTHSRLRLQPFKSLTTSSGPELMAGAAAAVVILTAGALVLRLCTRNSVSYKHVEPTKYEYLRLYPPPITLVQLVTSPPTGLPPPQLQTA